MQRTFMRTLLVGLLASLSSATGAQNTIKVGVIAEFSGRSPHYGAADRGRDEGVHEAARRHGGGQEDRADHARHRADRRPTWRSASRRSSITRDKVQFLAGFGLTPNAMAVAPVVTEAKSADDHLQRGDLDRSRRSRRTSRACR